MKAKELPPVDFLREMFDYDADTGIVTYRRFVNPRAQAGQVVGWKSTTGYLTVQINKQEYLLHRIVYSWVTGEILLGEEIVDHKNRCRDDNRWDNLRKVEKSGNNFNIKRRSDNTSGVQGVCFIRGKKKWQAKIGSRLLGYFSTKEEAILARLNAEKEAEVFIY